MPNDARVHDRLHQWLDAVGMPMQEVIDRGWSDSETQVSLLIDSFGDRHYLKQFQDKSKYRQETDAYRNWMAQFDSVVPALRLADEDNMRLLLSDLGECCCQWQELSTPWRQSLQFQAGQFLRKLHDLAFVDNDAMPLGKALLARTLAQQRAVTGPGWDPRLISAAEVARVVVAMKDLMPLANQFRRVPCHRDFWHRNWIWTAEQNGDAVVGEPARVSLGVLDFEHARPDLFLFDFMKNWSQCWLDCPAQEEAFWDGYGRRLTDDEQRLLRLCAKLHAIQTLLWATRHHHVEFAEQGRRLLAASA